MKATRFATRLLLVLALLAALLPLFSPATPVAAQGTDVFVNTYADAGRNTQNEQFTGGDTVYAKAWGTSTGHSYRFEVGYYYPVLQQSACRNFGDPGFDVDSYVIPSGANPGTMFFDVLEYDGTGCGVYSGTSSEYFDVAQAYAYKSPTLATATRTTSFDVNDTAYVVVRGLYRQSGLSLPWSTTWTRVGGGDSKCANLWGSDLPTSDQFNGRLPVTGSLQYPPYSKDPATPWNDYFNYDYDGTPKDCSGFLGTNAGQWQLTLRYDATHFVKFNVFTSTAVDVTPPVVTLQLPLEGEVTSDTTPAYYGVSGLTLGDTDSVITVRVYNGTTTSGALVQTLQTQRDDSTGHYWAIPTVALAEGTYTAQASQKDGWGNTGYSAPRTFTVDTTPVTVTIDSTLPSTIPSGGRSIITWHANGNGAYSIRIGGTNCSDGRQLLVYGEYDTAPNTTTWTIHDSDLSAGANTIRFCLTDGAGNLGSATTVITLATSGNLALTSVNGGANPTAGAPFAVLVQAKDTSGNPLTVQADTPVTISRQTGTGTIGGTLTGTIAAGTSQATISGLTYTKAESGVVLTATRTGGDSLVAADSAPFTVSPAGLDHLVLSPGAGVITAGASQAYTAEGFDAYGNDLGDVTATTMFSISPDGACTGTSCGATTAGLHTVTGTKDGKTGTASLAVTPATGTQVFAENFDGVTASALPGGWATAPVGPFGRFGGWTPTWATYTRDPYYGEHVAHSGLNFAVFNSFGLDTGESARLYRTAGVDLSQATYAVLSFWMHHDIAPLNDRVQPQVSLDGGTSWQNLGEPVLRYGPSTGWLRHTVDLSAYAGASKTDVRIAFLGISDFGFDCAIDDVAIDVATATVDTTPPTLVGMPANITTTATGVDGAVATYTRPTATDNVDPSPDVVCLPASGSLFPVGATTVTCTATDDAGNTRTGSFTVTVNATDTDGDGVPDYSDACVLDSSKVTPGVCGCGVADADSDNDGAADCHDTCPSDPLKIAAGQCGCGVPDADADGDGVAACNDICLLTYNPDQADADGDHVGDLCDGCLADPNKVDAGVCGCGVADTDSDHDGAADCQDACPSDPLKIAPALCGCGVADADSDNDGVPDCMDLCPSDPGKVEPATCGCGTQDTDADGDGIVDCRDNCPANYNPNQADADGDQVGNACDPDYDNDPPVLTVPAGVTAEATSAAGATVSFVASASDLVDPAPTVLCSHVSGSIFPLGTTTVSCTATDNAGRVSNPETFTVTVQDTTPPVVTVPDDLTAQATGPTGAVVTFIASANDLVDPSPALNCSPASGNTFALGITTVTCTATDSAGNTSSASFNVTVANAAPVVDAGDAASVDEGSTFSRSVSFVDPDANTWTATVKWDVGSPPVPLSVDQSAKTVPLSHAYADNGSYNVTVSVGDGIATASDTFVLTVNNVAPAVTAPSGQQAMANTSADIALGSFADPGADANWTVDVDWGDSSAHATFYATGVGSLGARPHTYLDGGNYTVAVKVTDKDGASGVKTFAVAVKNPLPTLGAISPASAMVGSGDVTLIVTGTGFVPGSKVRWFDSAAAELATTFISTTELKATIPGDSRKTVKTAEITVANPDVNGGGGTSGVLGFFVTEAAAPVTSQGSASGDDPEASIAGLTATGTGSGTVVVAEYAAKPGADFTYAAGTYFDVYVSPSNTLDQLVIMACDLNGGGKLRWWNGNAWLAASPQTYDDASHCVTLTVDSSSSPSLSQLSGTYFASEKASTSLLYTGQQIVVSGNALTPVQAVLSSAVGSCANGKAVTFAVSPSPDPNRPGSSLNLGSALTDASGMAKLDPVSTTNWPEGVYTLTASFAETTACQDSTDEATLTVASPGNAATGGGWYTLPGSGRVNFGFTVKKVDEKCTSNCAYKGQFLLINNGKWRLKGSLTSFSKTATVPVNGAANGTGDLYYWDATSNGGVGGWVLSQANTEFTISFADTAKSKKVAPDTFGIQIKPANASGGPGALPNSTPQILKGGDISIK